MGVPNGILSIYFRSWKDLSVIKNIDSFFQRTGVKFFTPTWQHINPCNFCSRRSTSHSGLNWNCLHILHLHRQNTNHKTKNNILNIYFNVVLFTTFKLRNSSKNLIDTENITYNYYFYINGVLLLGKICK